MGLGYIGLPTAIMFAKSGVEVLGVDVNRKVINKLNLGEVHIEENGLDDFFQEVIHKNLKVSTVPEESDAYIISVPTPINADFSANVTYVESAVKMIVPLLRSGNLVIVESTIPPRTIDDIVCPILESTGLKLGTELFVAHCPERVLPGRIFIELVENTRIVGGINPASTKKGAELYRAFVTGEIIETDALTAEMSKLMENTYRDVNIALANELVKISDKLGVKALDVIAMANKHPRVNIHFPGPGVGGHCLAVDPYFIVEKAPEEAVIISRSREINSSMPHFVADKCEVLLEGAKHKKIAVLGLAYKGNIDDIRESPAMEICELLLNKGYQVVAHDPYVNQEQTDLLPVESFEEAVAGSGLVLVLTDHKQFKSLTSHDLLSLNPHAIVFDTRNCINPDQMNEVAFYNYNNIFKIKEKSVLIKR